MSSINIKIPNLPYLYKFIIFYNPPNHHLLCYEVRLLDSKVSGRGTGHGAAMKINAMTTTVTSGGGIASGSDDGRGTG